MTAKRSLLAVLVLVVGMVCLLLTWPTKKPAGSLSVSFVGLTNDASGGQLAQFSVANHFPRQVRFGVCEPQFRQTNGWPKAFRVAGGAAWLPVAPGRERVFEVPAPPPGTNWRVPLVYQEDLSAFDNVRFRIELLAWGIARRRPDSPVPVRKGGNRFHQTFFTNSPEMLGTSSQYLQPTRQ